MPQGSRSKKEFMPNLALQEFSYFRDTWASSGQVGTQPIRIVLPKRRELAHLLDYREVTELQQTRVKSALVDFVNEAKRVDEVQAVIWQDSEDVTFLWTAISPLSEQIAAKVYGVEGKIYRKYPNAQFNFYVFSFPEGKGVRNSIPQGFEVLYSRQ